MYILMYFLKDNRFSKKIYDSYSFLKGRMKLQDNALKCPDKQSECPLMLGKFLEY